MIHFRNVALANYYWRLHTNLDGWEHRTFIIEDSVYILSLLFHRYLCALVKSDMKAALLGNSEFPSNACS